jgi:general stress protein 26
MKPSPPSTSKESADHFFEILQKFDTAILVTRAQSGSLHGRPLTIAKKELDGTLWFLTSVQSGKVAEVVTDSRTLVTMQSSNRFIVAHGIAELVPDRGKIDELWSEVQRVWFKGKDDPDIAVVRFCPSEAEFWDNAGALGIQFVFNAAKAIVSHEPMTDRGDPKAHGKVTLGRGE